MKLLYLDESGDHNLEKIDAKYPIFVLGGVIVDRTYSRTVLEPRVRNFKRKWFGTDAVVLHSTDITRARNGFERLRDRAFRDEFEAALSALMTELDYQVIACRVYKNQFVAQHGYEHELYDGAMRIVVEGFCREVGENPDGGLIFAEQRRPDLDLRLDIAWEKLSVRGTYELNRQRRGLINERICGLGLKAKGVNLPGLQLADLVVSVVGRHALGLPTHDNWDIVASKMCRMYGRIEGHGLITLPKN